MSARDAHEALRMQAATVTFLASLGPKIPPLYGLVAALQGYREDCALLASLGLPEPESPLATAARNLLTAVAAAAGFVTLHDLYEEIAPGALDGFMRGAKDAMTATLMRLDQAVGTAPVSLAFDDEVTP